VLPKVESPIPETIGLGAIFSMAGAGGVLLLTIATLLGVPERKRDAWGRLGVAAGCILGFTAYFAALVVQLVCRQ
jgi:hypothetical protein